MLPMGTYNVGELGGVDFAKRMSTIRMSAEQAEREKPATGEIFYADRQDGPGGNYFRKHGEEWKPMELFNSELTPKETIALRIIERDELLNKTCLAIAGQPAKSSDSPLAKSIFQELEESLEDEEWTCENIAHKINVLRADLEELISSLEENREPTNF